VPGNQECVYPLPPYPGATDPEGRELRFAYDTAGRLAESEDPASEGSRLAYEHEAAGRIVAERWADVGEQARYRYDERGR